MNINLSNVFASTGLVNLSGWSVKSSRNFNADEIAAVKSNEVVEQQYGKAVQFNMVNGSVYRLMLSRNSQGLNAGTQVDMNAAKLVVLSKAGSEDIIRVEV